MLDIHTHILPNVDDGCKEVQQSIRMLQSEAEQGIDVVAMTPHYHADRESPEAFIKRRHQAEQVLLAALYDRQNIPGLLVGAEVAYFDGMSRCSDIDLLRISHTNAMLIEMPFCRWSQRMLGELQQLRQMRGIQPILAHVERCMSYQPHGLIGQLAEQGMLIQVNASFFLRWQTAWKALRMLKQGSIHFVASDCHGLEYRPPNLGAAVERISRRLGDQALTVLEENAEKLFGGMK